MSDGPSSDLGVSDGPSSDPGMSVPKLSVGSCDSGMSSDMSVTRMPDGQPSPNGATLVGNSSYDEGNAVPESKMGRSVMFPPGERRDDGRRVSACAARTGLLVGVRVAALRDGVNVAGLRVGTCVTGAGLRVAMSGVVAVGRNEIPVEVPFTALLAPPAQTTAPRDGETME